MQRYFGEFKNVQDVILAFNLAGDRQDEMSLLVKGTLLERQILFAAYSVDGYEGSAFVLFRRGRKIYEVHSSHCSCNGLEWTPELTTWPALRTRGMWMLEGNEEAQATWNALLSRYCN